MPYGTCATASTLRQRVPDSVFSSVCRHIVTNFLHRYDNSKNVFPCARSTNLRMANKVLAIPFHVACATVTVISKIIETPIAFHSYVLETYKNINDKTLFIRLFLSV